MNKIKVIDLLNMISNGEEVPKKIKYKNKIYEWQEYDACYGKIMTKKGWVKELGYVAEENRTYFYLKHCYQDLNDEVEIIEEEKKVEPINKIYDITSFKNDYEEATILLKDTSNKLYEIIDEINKLKENKYE